MNDRLIRRVSEENRWAVRNDLITRIWSMARRQGPTTPYAVSGSRALQSARAALRRH